MDSSKSGLSMENNVMNTKLKAANQGPDGHTMDSFQDGGQNNQPTNRGNFLPNAEGNHINPDSNNFNQMSGNQSLNSDSYGKMSENATGPPGSNYNPGFNRANYGMSDQQHGSMNANSTGDMPQQHGQFSQFGQQNLRPGYPQMMRNSAMPGRSGMGMMPSNFNNPQRMMTAPNMQQQGGPTPTLNQLLTNSSSSQRYQGGGYNNYDMSQSKSGNDMNNSTGYNSQNWSGQSQQGSNPFQQPQMQGNQPFRNQGQLYDSQGRRPPGMGGSGYPDGGQYGQYPSSNQRYPMQQGYPQQMPYGQAGYNQSFMQQQQQMSGGPQQQQQQQLPPGSSPQPTSSQAQPTGQQQQQLPQQPNTPNSQPPQQPSPSPQQQQQNLSPQSNSSSKQASQDGPSTNSGQTGDENSDVNACTTPTPTSQNSGQSSSQPVPSPVGFAGSRSNTPASITGNQAGSPMPPRPPSTHEGRIQSPMATQGYSQQQMMPPPMHGGAAGQMGYPGKMGSHPNMMNNPAMGSQPYNNQYPNQGNFRGQPGMGGYSGQQGGYNGPMGNQMFPSNVPSQGGPMGMNRSMSAPNYPNSYQNNMSSQYGNYNGPSGMGPGNLGPGGAGNGPNAQGGMVQSGPGAMGNMSNNMVSNVPNTNLSSNGPSNTQGPPGPNQGPSGPTSNMPNAMSNMSPPNIPPNSMPGQQTGTPKGAQAAAQAAMIAAANMASTSNRGMYMRPQGDMTQQTSPNNQQQKVPGQFTPGQSQMGFNQNQMGVDNMNNMGPGAAPPGYNANMPNQDQMANQMQGMGPNSIPPNAVAPGSGMGIGGQPGVNMGGQMNAMGPPSMPPPSSMPTSSVASNNSIQNNMPTAMPSQADQSGVRPNTGASPASSEAMQQQNEETRPAASSAGDSNTIVTQSINPPVTTSTESSALEQRSGTPSQHSESSNQSQPGEITTNGPSSILQSGEDSNSQDALTGKARLQKLDSNSVAPSPSANSMSSQHDEFENISSPSWPGTPKPQTSESGKPEGGTTSAAAMKQYDMGEEPERKPFLDKLFAYLEDKGSPVTAMPMISKNPIDLFKLYTIVKEKGGLLEVTKGKKWREISSALNIGSSGSAGFTLRKNYVKYLFNYECTFDRGNMDPAPVLAQLEQMSGKKERKSTASPAAGMMDPFRPPNNQGFDGYGGQQRMGMNDMSAGGMGPGGMMHPNSNMMQNSQAPYGGGMMPNNSMPPNTSVMPNNNMMPNSSMPNSQMNMPNNINMGMPNSSQNSMIPNRPMGMPSTSGDNITVQDPFADNVQMTNSSQFPRPGVGSQLPPYNASGMQQQQQQQQNIPNSSGYFNRQPNSMSYNNNQQQGMNNQQQGPYMGGMGPGAASGNDPYRRGMAPGMIRQQQPAQQQPNQQQGAQQPDGFNNQFPNRQNSIGPSGVGGNNQFPFGASGDRFGQSSPAPPNQPSPAPSTHSQPDQSSQQGPGSVQPLPRPPSAASHTSSTASPAPPPPAPDSGTSSPMPPTVPTQQPPQQPTPTATPTPSESGDQTKQQGQQPTVTSQMPPNSQMNSQMPPTSISANSSSPMPQPNQIATNDQMPSASQMPPSSSVSSMPSSQMSMMPNSQMSSMGNQMQAGQQMAGSQMGNQMPFSRYGSQNNQYQQGGMGPQSGMGPQGAVGQQGSMGLQTGMNQGYNQQRGCPQTSMGGQMSGSMPGYGQQQSMGGYSGQKPMSQQYPQQKPYSGYGQRDGYNMQPGYQGGGYSQQSQYGSYNQQSRPGMGPQDSQAGMMNGPSMGPGDSMYGGVGPNMYGGSMSASGYPSYTDDYTDPMRSSGSSGQTSPWTSAMQQRFSASGHYTQNQQQMPPTTGMSGHYGSMYNRMNMSHRMSPQRSQEKPFFGTPQKQKSIAGSFQPKKDIVFPPDSVEATQPILQKRKRLTFKDVCPVDPWKIIMALKSGLMAESTWALDSLTILLFDDHTIPWFSLLHLPGLLEVLLDHFRQTLIQIFPGHFEDLEVQTERQRRSIAKRFKREHKTSLSSSGEASDSDDNNEWDRDVFISPSKEVLNSPENYTMKTRKGSTVQFDEKDKDDEYVRDKKKWDSFSGFSSDTKHWQDGRGDLSCHVQTKFHSENTLEFFRKQFFGKENCKHIKTNNLVVTRTEIKKELLEEDDNKEKVCDATDTCDSEKSETRESANASPTVSTSVVKKEISDAQGVKCERSDNNSPQPPSISNDMESVAGSTADGNADTAKRSPVREYSDSACPSPPVLSSEVEVKKEPAESSDQNVKMEVDSVKFEENLANNVKCDDVKTNVKVEEKPIVRSKQDIKDEMVDPDILNEISAEEVKIMESIKRKWEECEEENEAYQRDSASLSLITSQQEELAKRCVCLSNILRSLSFVPGNDRELSAHHGLMLTLGRLLLLHHRHPKRKREQRKFDREEPDIPIEDTIEDGLDEWWWDALYALRENSLVILANITGKMKLIDYPEEVSITLLEGLIHWAVCPSSQAQDPLPTMSANSVLSPRRLVLEAMCKLSIKEHNVDLMLATPPFTRIVQLLSILVDMLANRKEQVMREFSIVLLSALVAGDNSAARAVALLPPTISLLIDFLETAEQQAMTVANSHGVNMLRDNPEMMGTSLDMLRRAASMLLHMARVPENRTLFLHQQQRLLQLVMSHILDSQISGIIADILFHCSDQVNDDTPS